LLPPMPDAAASNLPPRQEGEPFKQMHILFILQ
jgi:hypothetical protein